MNSWEEWNKLTGSIKWPWYIRYAKWLKYLPFFNRKDRCIGLTLFRFGRRKLELWFVPANYACVEHTHKDSDGEFFVVYGRGRDIWRKTWPHWLSGAMCQIEVYNITNRHYFKTYTVRANTPHGFSVGSTLMVFLCWETYRKGVPVTSPAVDFHPVTTQ